MSVDISVALHHNSGKTTIMNFAQLMGRAATLTAESHSNLKRKEDDRLQAEKQTALIRAQKEAADKRAELDRIRERQRIEREKLAEEERKKTALPLTRNLGELKKERVKRGLDPDGKDDHLVGHISHGSTTIQKPPSFHAIMRKAALVQGSSMKILAPSKKQKEPLSREEKLARERTAMFMEDANGRASSGSMELAKKAALAATPVLSKQNDLKPKSESRYDTPQHARLDQGRHVSNSPRPSLPPPPTSSIMNKQISQTVSISKSKHLKGSSAGSSGLRRSGSTGSVSSVGSSSTLNARDRLKNGFKPNEFQKLNLEKRDRRTIEEIELDLKEQREKAKQLPSGSSKLPIGTKTIVIESQKPTASKSAEQKVTCNSGERAKDTAKTISAPKSKNPPQNAMPAKKRPRSRSPPPPTKSSSTKRARSLSPRPGLKGSGRDQLNARNTSKGKSKGQAYSGRKSKELSSGSETTGEDDDSDEEESETSSSYESGGRNRNRQNREEPRRHRQKGRGGYGLDPGTKSEIWKIMGRDRARDLQRDYDSDEGSSDMEVSHEEERREEARAARLAQKEDEEEQERLRVHAEAKRKRLAKAGKAKTK